MVTGYDGVKFDDKGQNMLASSLVTQMRGGQYVAIWPKDARHRRDHPSLQGLVSARHPRRRRQPMSMTLLQVVVSGLLLGAVYALFSSGLTLIWGMMNVVNFAHGDFVMLGMYTAVVIWTALGGGPWASVPVAAILIATLGVVSYFLLVRHIMKGPMLAQILGTFGLALFLRYAAFWTSAPISGPCPTRWSAAPSCWAASASRARACWPASSGSPSPCCCTSS